MVIPECNLPDFYSESLRVRLTEVYHELHPYVNESYFVYAGLNPEHSILDASEESIIQDITLAYNRNKRKIFFDCIDEAFTPEVVDKTHNIAKVLKEKYTDIKCILIFGSANSQETYIQWCIHRNVEPKLEILSYYFFECMAKQQWMHSQTKTEQYRIEPKKKIYTCLNRVLRRHRFAFLDKMLGTNLVNENCYYSFHNSQMSDGGHSFIKQWASTDFPNIDSHYDLVTTLRLNFDKNRINPADLRVEDFHLFHDSYFSVIPETNYYHDSQVTTDRSIPQYAFFSEKTYKPIVLLQPFILLGMKHSLARLRDRGFKTFHPYIDESYDTIIDDDLRMDYIVNEVARLSNQSENEWLTWQENIKPIVEHNLVILRSQTSYIGNKDLINRL